MPEQLLKRICFEYSPGEFLQSEAWYVPGLPDPDIRQLGGFTCTPFQLPAGTELARSCTASAAPEHLYGVLVIQRYDGEDGYIYERQENNAACPVGCSLDSTELTAEYEIVANPADPDNPAANIQRWKLTCQVSSVALPISAVLNGTNQVQPQTITGSPATVTFYLPPTQVGFYDVTFSDAAGCEKTTNRVQLQMAGESGVDLDLYSFVYARDIFEEQSGQYIRTIFERIGQGYHLATHSVRDYQIETQGPAGQGYSRDTNEEIDRYLLPDGRTLRQVYHAGLGEVRYVDTVPDVTEETGELTLLNLIKTDIDEAGTATGRVWAEANSPAPPVSFTLTGPLSATNQTGQFSNLPAGGYTLTLSDAAGRTYQEEFSIEDRYRRRWWLEYDALDSTPMRLDLLLRDHAGADTRVCGNGEPLAYGWQGAGGDPTGNIPEAWGHTVDIVLLDENPEQFLRLGILDDRECRVDVYAGNELVFRGYVAPGTFRHRLLGGHQEVSLLASCGLGALQNVPLLNHRGELLRGRRPLLSTLLHCLSRCDTNLPLYVASNLREVSMLPDGEPLLETWAQRTAYGTDEEKLPRTKEALESILRTLHAVLFQRGGAWWLESAMEADAAPARRAFTQEGLPAPAPAAPATWHILPGNEATGPTDLYWVQAEQTREVVPAAAAVQAVVGLQLESNLLENGDFARWTPDRTRPLGWTVTDAGGLGISRVGGEKAGEYAAELLANEALTGALLSAPVFFVDSSAADPVRVQVTARVPAGPPALDINGKDQTPPRVVRVVVRLLYDGVPEPETLEFEFTSADKRDTQSAFIPSGYGGKSVRVQVLPPQLLSGPVSVSGNQVRVQLESVVLDILPSLVDWPAEDRFTALNAERGYLLLDEVKLLHADVPVLAGPNGLPLSASATGVLAWRHALSKPDGRPTRAWARPGQSPLPLLERAATERMALRTTPGEVVTGSVYGPGLGQLGAGMLLDMVADIPGKWWVVSCRHLPRLQAATLVLRKLSDGDFTGTPVLSGRVRYTSRGPRYTSRRKYRTA